MSERLRAPGFALLVIGLDGEEEYLCDGMGDRPSRFFSRKEAQSQKDFMWIGMEGDVQSINIVPYPKQPSHASEKVKPYYQHAGITIYHGDTK